MSVLPHLEVLLLQDSSTTTLNELRCGRPMVLDFWWPIYIYAFIACFKIYGMIIILLNRHTKCVRCPAALERMNNEASSRTDVLFTACALSQGDGNEELVKEMVSERWYNFHGLFFINNSNILWLLYTAIGQIWLISSSTLPRKNRPNPHSVSLLSHFVLLSTKWVRFEIKLWS